MLRSDFWDDGEKEARLREMAAAGLSSGTIAAVLHCSRNAVVGKANRLGLRLTGRVSDGQTNANIPGAETPKPRRLPRPVRSEPTPTPFDVLPEIVHEEPMDDLPGVAFADLNSTHCRAIGADGRYCGAPIAHEKFSYCAKHKAVYLTTPAKLRAQQREDTAVEGRAKLGRWG